MTPSHPTPPSSSAASASAAPRIWVDVTTLTHWQRPAVGIVRVEQQLCLWLLEHASGIGWCRYERPQRQFHAVSSLELRAHLARIDGLSQPAAADPAAPPPEAAPRPPLGLRLRHALKTGLESLPTPLRHPLLAALINLGLMRPPPPSVTPAEPAAPPSLEFAPGSVHVSLGLDWDYKDMADIYAKKQAQGFQCLFMCYDTIPVLMPQLCVADVSRQFAHYFADLAWCADHILCISQCTERDLLALLRRLQVPAPATSVIRLGADILPQGSSATAQPAATPAADTAAADPQLTRLLAGEAPFVLFVSTIERRKNHEVLYRAWSRLAASGRELPLLVFVGMPGWGVDELISDLALDPRVAGRILQLHRVCDSDLARLYQQALFTVYPSLYEGWGLPVAESLAFGKYCLCSSAASLPEVGGDWVDYLDPWDLPGWVERLAFLLDHPDWVAARNAAIARDYQPHPWSATAAEIFAHALRLRQTP